MFAAPLALALATLPAQLPPPVGIKMALPPGAVMKPPPGPPAPGLSLAAGGEAALRSVWIDTSSAGLLDFFRKRTPPAPPKDTIAALVKKLSSKNDAERDAASGALVSIGQAAVPLLRQAANNVDDLAGSARARACLAAVEGANASLLAVQAARLLAQRKPAGAPAVLLGYLPFAEDDAVFAEVESALVRASVTGGKVDPALVKALKDKVAIRRGAAAQVLCQAGGTAYHKAVRPLLKDPRASVRLRAALGLVGAYDAEAIPVLIDLLADLPPRLRQQAEDYLTHLAGEWAVRGPGGNDLMARQLRRQVWLAWWKQTDGDKLLEEFRSRTISDAEREKVLGLIAKLDDASDTVRNASADGLIALGPRAASLLRRARQQDNSRISELAGKCLEAIEKDTPNPLPAAAPRLLGLRRPEGGVEALLAYLPLAESDEMAEQIMDVLGAVGVRAGQPDKALLEGLKDKVPLRRAAAAVALIKGRADDLSGARRLLKDANAEVRLRTARGLADAGEKDAVPVLIALLADLPLDQAFEVEDYLVLLAGDKAPSAMLTADAGGRTRAVEGWQSWWKENSARLDLARVDRKRRELGYYLVVENWNPMGGKGRVMELDPSGKTRWQLTNLYSPTDARLLRNGNVLVVEGSRVTERTKDNKELWGRYYSNPFSCQQLRNGNFFIACRNQLLEVTREGRIVFNHYYGGGTILAARRFRDGSTSLLSYAGQYVKLDRAGKQVKTIQFPLFGMSLGGADILTGDRVVISINGSPGKVIEYNASARPVWECPLNYPGIPYRLANGNTIVGSASTRQITEIDPRGKVIAELKGLSYQPFRVTKR
jgi:HEAT repeat protein